MEALVFWLFIVGLATIMLAVVLGPALQGFYYMIACGALLLFTVLDSLFSASLIPGVPWLMWGFWGAVIGGALGFWTLAPVYGLRNKRTLIACAPFAAMLLIMLLRINFTTPHPVNQLSPLTPTLPSRAPVTAPATPIPSSPLEGTPLTAPAGTPGP